VTGRRRTLALGALIAATIGLSGCISLFPKSKPATLYRFGASSAAAPAAASAPTAQTFAILKATTGFPRAAATDQILTVTEGETAYIATGRWVSPAVVLFDEAVARVFDADPGPARLVVRGETARTDYTLKLDVRTFEAQYLNGPKAAPEVVVAVRALMTRNSDNAMVGEQMFEARVRAGDNRVSAIAAAFDQAVSKTLGEIVQWTNGRGAPGAAAPAGR
jgi:cholesterol transport system auxiliary component